MASTKLEVIESGTGEVVKTIDVTGKSDGHVDKVFRGLLRSMDTDKFYVKES